MSVDELIAAANTLNEPDLDRVLHQIATLRARRKSPVLPEEESKLLLKINQPVPSDLRWSTTDLRSSDYQVLLEKREAETLTDDEYSSLIELSQRIESIGAERLEALATLAQLRQTSLLELMKTLGIEPVSYV
jgi:hypothetical protein